MSGPSNIEWTEATWNPIVGCSIHSPGCANCYAMRMAHRLSHNPATPHYAGTTKLVKGKPVFTGLTGIAPDSTLLAPLRWKKPRTIFVNSMGDLFHQSITDEMIDRVFAVMTLCPHHTFQVLTKRAGRMRSYFSVQYARGFRWLDAMREIGGPNDGKGYRIHQVNGSLPNVWLGVSTERQQEADERIPDLLATPAAVRFISAEPLLGPLDIREWRTRLNWIIVGGESGPGARPMHPEWARSLRDQCAGANVPFFFKQWGEWGDYVAAINVSRRHALCGLLANPPALESNWASALDFLGKTKEVDGAGVVSRVGKKAAGRLLDGREHNHKPQAREVSFA